MYATVRSYAGSGDLVDALVENEDAVRQLISGIGGFHSYCLVRADGGEAVSVSIYDDRAGAEESNQAAAGWIRENLPDLAISPPHVSAGEVVISI